MTKLDKFPPTLAAAEARVAAIRPDEYARSRNALDGAVTGLSPYLTHGFLTLPEVLHGLAARHALGVQHKLVYELGWREYCRHVWRHRGNGIFDPLHEGVLPDSCYAFELPADIREARTGVAAIDLAVRTLYATGYLHNHARMWLASYTVHLRKIHWRAGADWMYAHLLDGDLASNHLGWQWVAGTASRKPYLFNAENVARFAPAPWHSPDSVIDASYETLDALARMPRSVPLHARIVGVQEPDVFGSPPAELQCRAPGRADVDGRDVWLLHPWALHALPVGIPASTVCIGVFVEEFHRERPWSAARWSFVGARMSELAPLRWWGAQRAIADALQYARSVRTTADPHLFEFLRTFADCARPQALFPEVPGPCASFSQWWTHATRGVMLAEELPAVHQLRVPAT